jgi:hypothetical protein
VEQQQPDGFSAHFWNQTAFHCLFGYQSHRPASPTRRRIAADHGDNSLSFRRFQQCYRAGALLVVESLVQTRYFVPTSNLAHGLGTQGHQSGNFGSRLPLIQLLQSQSAKYSAHRLDATAEQAVQLATVRLFEAHLQPPISSHAPG